MIRAFARIRQLAATRSATALLLAFALNVAFVPCAMAIEVVADEHDCCPAELRLEPADCCEVNDGSIQSRGTTFEFDEDDTLSLAPAHAQYALGLSGRDAPVGEPPDPPDTHPDLNALYCVYLK